MTICHSRDRATIRLLRMKYQSRRARLWRVQNAPRLHPSPENQSVEQEQKHGANQRADKSRGLPRLVPANCLTEISGNERACNTEKNRHDAAAGIPSRHQQFRNRADNKTDNQNPEDRVRAEVHMRTRFIELIASRQGIGLKFCGWHSRSLRGIS